MASSKSANVRLGLNSSPLLKGLKDLSKEGGKAAKALESVLSAALKQFDKAVEASAKRMQKAFGGGGFRVGGGTIGRRGGKTAQEYEAERIEKAAKAAEKAAERAAAKAQREAAKAQREAAKAERDASRAAAKEQRDQDRKGASRYKAASSALKTGAAYGAALGGGGLLLAKEANEVRELANRLSINARGSGEAYADPDKLAKAFFKVSQDVKGVTGAQAAEAAKVYIGKTGNMKAAMDSLGDFATVASATETSMSDVAQTAAAIAKQFVLTDPKDIRDVLASLTYQGKSAEFELTDAASLMPRLAAAGAGLGGLTGVEGVKSLGGLAQISRANFGNSESSVTAIERLITTFTEKSDKLRAAGVNVYDAKNQKRDLKTLIFDSIQNIGGNDQAAKEMGLSKIFGEGFKSISGLNKTYNRVFAATKGTDKEKSAAGRKAMEDEFNKAANAAGTWSDIVSDSKKAQEDASAKATAAFERLKMAASERLLPALLKLEPKIMTLMDAFTRAVEWAASNPAKAISAAIVAGIAKEAIGSAISSALSKAMGNAPMKLGAVAFTIAAATIIAGAIIERRDEGARGSAEQRASVKADIEAAQTKNELGPDDLARLKSDRAVVQKQIKEGQAYFENGHERYGGEGVFDTIGGGFNQIWDVVRGKTTFEDIGRGKEAEAKFPELLEQRAAIDSLIAKIEKGGGKPNPLPGKMEIAGTPKVIIANPKDIGAGGPPTPGFVPRP